jgi:hypothetical protein
VQWFEAHPGTASWLEAIGSITAIVFVYLFALYQGRRTRSHENTDRIRRAQGLALVLIPVLTAFRSKIEAAIVQESKPAAPDEVMHLLDQIYILGVAGGLIPRRAGCLRTNRLLVTRPQHRKIGSGTNPNNRNRHRQAGRKGADNHQGKCGKQICLRAQLVYRHVACSTTRTKQKDVPE